MICMPKAERLWAASQGLCALTDVLITSVTHEETSALSCDIQGKHLHGYQLAMQYLALEIESATYDAWENADNPTYLNEEDQKQAREEMHGLSDTVSVLTWIQKPVTVKGHPGATL